MLCYTRMGPVYVFLEAYHLSWESFQTNLSSTLGGLLQGNLADVTLVSEVQIQMQSHRIVLSACSPVLKNLLICNPSSHPLIHLMGAKQQDIQSILQFMYLGEAAVNKDHIDEVIEIAKDLQMEEILHYYTKGESIENIKEDKEVGDIDKTTAAYRMSPAGGRRLVSAFQLV